MIFSTCLELVRPARDELGRLEEPQQDQDDKENQHLQN